MYKFAYYKSGYFEIVNISESQNLYTLKISKASYLIRTIPNILLTRNIEIGSKSSPIIIWAGDFQINGVQDNAINMADVIEFAKRFNSVVGDNRYSYDIDINKDNSINMADVLIMARNFNKTDSSYPSVEISTPSISPSPTHSVSGAPSRINFVEREWYFREENSPENLVIYKHGDMIVEKDGTVIGNFGYGFHNLSNAGHIEFIGQLQGNNAICKLNSDQTEKVMISFNNGIFILKLDFKNDFFKLSNGKSISMNGKYNYYKRK